MGNLIVCKESRVRNSSEHWTNHGKVLMILDSEYSFYTILLLVLIKLYSFDLLELLQFIVAL